MKSRVLYPFVMARIRRFAASCLLLRFFSTVSLKNDHSRNNHCSHPLFFPIHARAQRGPILSQPVHIYRLFFIVLLVSSISALYTANHPNLSSEIFLLFVGIQKNIFHGGYTAFLGDLVVFRVVAFVEEIRRD